MSVKYGPIICDPNSEEAKKLIGKKVIGSDSYLNLSSLKSGRVFELARIDVDMICPFMDALTESSMGYTFIREVIEEKPKYRPYNNTCEMVKDFNERFSEDIFTSSMEMPRIWLKNDSGSSVLVTAFCHEHIKSFDLLERLDEVFKRYTYLDGSPVGKEEEE